MTKRLKAPAIQSADEFFITVNQIASLQADAAVLVARRDRAIQRIQERFQQMLAPFDTAMKAKLSLADAYAEEHRSELLPKGKKSVDLACATFGWRTGNPTVKFTSKKVTDESVIAVLKVFGLGAYVRTVEQVAKDKILADAKTIDTPVGKVVGLPAVLDEDGVAAPEGATWPLSNAGLKIAQTETFFIEPKVDSAETLKPASAAA